MFIFMLEGSVSPMTSHHHFHPTVTSRAAQHSRPLQPPSASSHRPFPGAQSHRPGSSGVKLEAVMENLQQVALLDLEEKLRQTEKEKKRLSMVESQIH
eukprot:superscaffoldBa00008205_g23162